MSNEIIPMSKSEIKHLDFVVSELKNKYRKDISERMMNDGFSMASILNFDNDFIMIEVKYGVSISIPELCFADFVKISRQNMEVVETKDKVAA